MTDSQNLKLFLQAQQCFPGGVNSPVRAFKAVQGCPIYLERAEGAYLYDADGKRYIDFVNSWGPALLGHNPPHVQQAMFHTSQGLACGMPHALEIMLAEEIFKRLPALERIRLTTSGTEATMTAIRLARAATGRDKIIKFSGCYHGHHDSVLVEAGSGALTFGHPSSPGVPKATGALTLSLPFNDLDTVEQAFQKNPGEIACVILEPIVGNMGCILPKEGYLEGLRSLCTRYGALLIFDEVMTGFRVDYGGAQTRYNIQPDLSTFGKVIGGGMPIGAVAGPQKYMDLLAPLGPVYQASTLSAHPMVVACGLATLQSLTPDRYTHLSELSDFFLRGLQALQQKYDCFRAVGTCGMVGIHFASTEAYDLASIQKHDMRLYRYVYHRMLDQGVYWPPSIYEAFFISLAHTEQDLQETLEAFEQALQTYHRDPQDVDAYLQAIQDIDRRIHT